MSALAPSRGEVAVRSAFLAYVGLLIAAPVGALAWAGLQHGVAGFAAVFASSDAVDALVLSIWTALLAAAVQAVMGTAIAWALVRVEFPGRKLLSALVDLPLTLPSLVAGVLLVGLFGPQTLVGGWLVAHGFPIAFAAPGIVLALLFVTLPFVVRSVEPVMRELDPAEEEAAITLGARPSTVFFRIVLPPLLPAIATGTGETFARALAEFGSIAVVSGNLPHRTLTVPVWILGQVEDGKPETAAAMSLVLLGAAVLVRIGIARAVKHV